MLTEIVAAADGPTSSDYLGALVIMLILAIIGSGSL